MRRRVLILPLSAVVIAALCAFKLSRSEEPPDPDRPIVLTRRAPFFQLYNQHKPPQLVWLKSYIGRHHIVLVFFDPHAGFEADPVLVWLRQNAEALQSRNVKVFAISEVLPQTHRKLLKDWLAEDEPPPFQFLTDLSGSIHRLYGRFDKETEKLLTGVFLIDRAGNLPWDQNHPLPLEHPLETLRQEFLDDYIHATHRRTRPAMAFAFALQAFLFRRVRYTDRKKLMIRELVERSIFLWDVFLRNVGL